MSRHPKVRSAAVLLLLLVLLVLVLLLREVLAVPVLSSDSQPPDNLRDLLCGSALGDGPLRIALATGTQTSHDDDDDGSALVLLPDHANAIQQMVWDHQHPPKAACEAKTVTAVVQWPSKEARSQVRDLPDFECWHLGDLARVVARSFAARAALPNVLSGAAIRVCVCACMLVCRRGWLASVASSRSWWWRSATPWPLARCSRWCRSPRSTPRDWIVRQRLCSAICSRCHPVTPPMQWPGPSIVFARCMVLALAQHAGAGGAGASYRCG
jgi:hypothetical protein